MANYSHFKLLRDVKIDGIDFKAGVYPIDKIDSGRHSSIIKAGWGEYCGEHCEAVTPEVKPDPSPVKLTFAQLVSALLVAEYEYSKEKADRMVKKHTDLIANGIMSGNLGATAMAIEIQESKMHNIARVLKLPATSKLRDKYTGQEFTGEEIHQMCPWLNEAELANFFERFVAVENAEPESQ